MIAPKVFVFLNGVFLGLFFPLWPNWLLEAGLPLSILAENFFIATTVGLLLNIPTGKFADRFSPRTSLQVGTTILLSSVLVTPLFEQLADPNLSLFVLIVSSGSAFISGALQASYGQEFELRTGNHLTNDGVAKRMLIERSGMILGALSLVPLSLSSLSPIVSFGILPAAAAGMLVCSFSFQHKTSVSEPKSNSTNGFTELFRSKLAVGCLFLGLAFGCMQVVFWPKIQNTVTIGLAAGAIQAILSTLRSTGIQIWRKSGAIEIHNSLFFALPIAGILLALFSFSTTFVLVAILWTLMVFALSSHDILLEQKIVAIDKQKVASNLSVFFTLLSIGTATSSFAIARMPNIQTEEIGVAGAILFCISALAFRVPQPTHPTAS